jgi:anthranilate phosphoribosyltransferase
MAFVSGAQAGTTEPPANLIHVGIVPPSWHSREQGIGSKRPKDGREQNVKQRLTTLLNQLSMGHNLTREQARWTFDRIMAGELEPIVIGALLGAMIAKGESVDELVGAAEAMRAAGIRISCDGDCIDTCGTGGDGISTFNVSTTAGIIAASAGAIVAKHGNRSTTRASGSTEVLHQLGVDVDAPTDVVERCLREVRIGYLNARQLHPAMKFAVPVRRAIPARTIFNLLGPLTNPAGARRQILGVPHMNLLDKMADTLLALNATHAWVVHGCDGLCDLTITGPTTVVEIRHGTRNRFSVTPGDVGLSCAPLDSLIVDSPAASAQAVMGILQGQSGPRRDHALLNAGAALVVAGIVGDIGEGVDRAGGAVDDGSALATLERWRAMAPILQTDAEV